jgi:hypothetical protein
MKKILLPVALWSVTIIFAAPIFAQNSSSTAPDVTWSRVNAGGGGFNHGIVLHPAVPDLVYARQDVMVSQ